LVQAFQNLLNSHRSPLAQFRKENVLGDLVGHKLKADFNSAAAWLVVLFALGVLRTRYLHGMESVSDANTRVHQINQTLSNFLSLLCNKKWQIKILSMGTREQGCWFSSSVIGKFVFRTCNVKHSEV
jgi:hypothetical protein